MRWRPSTGHSRRSLRATSSKVRSRWRSSSSGSYVGAPDPSRSTSGAIPRVRVEAARGAHTGERMTFDPDKALELLDRVKSEDPNYEPRWILQEYLWSNAESICRELATARSAADRLHDERFAEARKVDALTEQRHHYRSALARANAEMARQGRLAKDQRDAILETHKEAARNQQAAFEQWNAEMDTLRRERDALKADGERLEQALRFYTKHHPASSFGVPRSE